jgi:hypothetical protein
MNRTTFGRLLGVALCVVLLGSICLGFEIMIDVSPKTLNIQSEGEVVTVHTDISYWAVDVYSVYLNGVYISSWKADNRGNFVAKFEMDVIKKLPELHIGDYNTLTLTGATKDGEAFTGSTDIMVIDVQPRRR